MAVYPIPTELRAIAKHLGQVDRKILEHAADHMEQQRKWLDALEAIAMMQAKEECSLAAEMRKTALEAIAS